MEEGKITVDAEKLWMLVDHLIELRKSWLAGLDLAEIVNGIIDEVIRIINN